MAQVCFKKCPWCSDDCKNIYSNINARKEADGKADWSALGFRRYEQSKVESNV